MTDICGTSKAPKGWCCTRDVQHDGPCALVELAFERECVHGARVCPHCVKADCCCEGRWKDPSVIHTPDQCFIAPGQPKTPVLDCIAEMSAKHEAFRAGVDSIVEKIVTHWMAAERRADDAEKALKLATRGVELRNENILLKLDRIAALESELAETEKHLQAALDRAQRLMDARDGKVSS